jgi:acyl-coenzyme A thioesterase PaaI-like protein
VSGGQLRAESQVVSMTRTTAIVRVEVSNGDRLACIAQGTLLLRDPKPSA